MISVKDPLPLKGRVEIFVSEKAPKIIPVGLPLNLPGPRKIYADAKIDFSAAKLLYVDDNKNLVVNAGKDQVIQSLGIGIVKQVCRMAIGDRGTIPSDSTQPKTFDGTRTSLFNEVYRDDVDVTTLNIGPSAVPAGTHEIKFIKTFDATTIPLNSFSNQAAPVVNEVGLIAADLFTGAPLPRAPVAAPSAPLADEDLYAMRTFKSVPFDAANQIAVTIRYTLFTE